MKKYDGKNCPCPSDCVRRGRCAECIKFHRGRGEQTYCEYMVDGSPEEPVQQATGVVYGGRELRLLDYAQCAEETISRLREAGDCRAEIVGEVLPLAREDGKCLYLQVD